VGGRGVALGASLIGAGLLAGVLIGRSSVSRPTDDEARAGDDEEPALASSRSVEGFVDTTPLAAEPEAQPPAVAAPAEPAPAVTAPLVTPAPAPKAAPAPAAPKAPAPAPAAEPNSTPATPAASPPAPPPDPRLVSQGRVFNDDAITSSSFDDEDVSEYDVVPDHEVTRSSFDDEDRVDRHPTGD